MSASDDSTKLAPLAVLIRSLGHLSCIRLMGLSQQKRVQAAGGMGHCCATALRPTNALTSVGGRCGCFSCWPKRGTLPAVFHWSLNLILTLKAATSLGQGTREIISCQEKQDLHLKPAKVVDERVFRLLKTWNSIRITSKFVIQNGLSTCSFPRTVRQHNPREK